MRTSKRIFIWIVFSLVFQFSLYIFMERYYYADEGTIKIQDMNTDEEQKKITPNVVFDSNAKDISLSDDLSYTAYLKNGQVNVVDTNTGKPRDLTYSKGVQCLAYKWVPTTNIVIIAEKLNNNQIRFYSYDAENQTKVEISEKGKVNSVPAGQTVEMQTSDLTGLLYVKVGYGKASYNIYRMDRNETLTRVSTAVKNIGTIALASDDDQLAYEDLVSGKIRTNFSPKPTITIQGVQKPSVIGTDGSDNFYIGNGSKQSDKLYYGTLADSTSHWDLISLGKTVNNDDIIITQSGNVYIVDKESGSVTDYKSHKSYSYEGRFCEINNGYIVYTRDDKLMLKQIQ